MKKLISLLFIALLGFTQADALTLNQKLHSGGCSGSGSQTFNTGGAHSFTVPGCGVATIIMDSRGAGGGGGGRVDFYNGECVQESFLPGGNGGAGGKGVSTRLYSTGTSISITVGSAGTAGVAGNATCGPPTPVNGGSGGLSKAEVGGSPVSQGNGGDGGVSGGAAGSNGTATGDTTTTGGGSASGAGSGVGNGAAGTVGSVIITWSF